MKKSEGSSLYDVINKDKEDSISDAEFKDLLVKMDTNKNKTVEKGEMMDFIKIHEDKISAPFKDLIDKALVNLDR